MGYPPDHVHERILVTRCRTGDERAFMELVERYQPRLGYFVWKMLGRGGGTSAPEDVMQDVWLDVFRGLPGLKDAAAFPAWAFRIARDRVYRELRRAASSETQVVPLGEADPPDVDDDAGEFGAEDVALVHECLDELTPEHREVLVLRFLQGMSYEEVAGVARCEVGTVRSRLHYAKGALRRAMERKRQP